VDDAVDEARGGGPGPSGAWLGARGLDPTPPEPGPQGRRRPPSPSVTSASVLSPANAPRWRWPTRWLPPRPPAPGARPSRPPSHPAWERSPAALGQEAAGDGQVGLSRPLRAGRSGLPAGGPGLGEL